MTAQCYIARSTDIYCRTLYPYSGVLKGSEHILYTRFSLLFLVRLQRLSAIQISVVRRKDGINWEQEMMWNEAVVMYAKVLSDRSYTISDSHCFTLVAMSQAGLQ